MTQAVVEGDAIRLGLSSIHGFGPEQIELLEQERWRGPYKPLTDLVKRTGLDRPHVEALVLASALDYMGERRQSLWNIAEAYRLARRPKELPMKSKETNTSSYRRWMPERGWQRPLPSRVSAWKDI